jgi:hypothetical protein
MFQSIAQIEAEAHRRVKPGASLVTASGVSYTVTKAFAVESHPLGPDIILHPILLGSFVETRATLGGNTGVFIFAADERSAANAGQAGVDLSNSDVARWTSAVFPPPTRIERMQMAVGSLGDAIAAARSFFGL